MKRKIPVLTILFALALAGPSFALTTATLQRVNLSGSLFVLSQGGTTATAITYTLTAPAQLECVRIHTSAASTATLYVTVDSVVDPVLDHVLNSQSMVGLTDYAYIPTRPAPMRTSDKLLITWANSTSRVWGVEIWFRGL